MAEHLPADDQPSLQACKKHFVPCQKKEKCFPGVSSSFLPLRGMGNYVWHAQKKLSADPDDPHHIGHSQQRSKHIEPWPGQISGGPDQRPPTRFLREKDTLGSSWQRASSISLHSSSIIHQRFPGDPGEYIFHPLSPLPKSLTKHRLDGGGVSGPSKRGFSR
ncbi:hypothetical protein PGTUg99_019019 [Puccinia graminis f. sp. tritici]|uniref:Uncharacterized protein n=1 Tax=Puccinia graminis f. sp. tritici TaxID=56615 RepID=A0A5B0Q1I2_PUCGR|nr:hypothetical protein PGTUg99_019019 [Puccinia graminis f. sp. tritici]